MSTKGKPKKSKKKFPVSTYTSREFFRVSSASLWPEAVWRLDSKTYGQRNYIGWRFPLPDGTVSMDKENEELLESFREVYWGMMTNGAWYGKSLSPGSAAIFGTGMRELFRWMIFRGYRSFEELNDDAHSEYLQDIPIILASRSKFYSTSLDTEEDLEEESSENDFSPAGEGLDLPEDISEEDAFSHGQVAIRIKILYFIYSQSELLFAQGLPTMTIKPFSGLSAGEVAQKVAKYTINRIPPLPDEVALPLLRESLNWIEYKCRDILLLQTNYLERRQQVLLSGMSDSSAIKASNSVLYQFEFCSLPGESAPWRPPITQAESNYNPQHGEVHLDATQILRKLVMKARDAAVLILQYMVGLRVNEVCSIKGGWNDAESLPSCIERRFSKSGMLEMFFLKAVVSKGVPQPRDDEWLLGCRPAGSSHLPATLQALIVLESLFRPWRQLRASDALIVSFSQPKSLPQTSTSVGDITGSALLRGAKYFVYSEVDLSDLDDTNDHGEDLAMYRNSKGLCIRTHQGRKTFAAYMLEARSSLLKTVSQHFKHLTIAVTEAAYYPSVSRLRGDAESIRVAQSIAFFMEAIQGKRVYGRMAELVTKFFGQKEWKKISDYAKLERKVTELVQTHDLRIFFADYGNCLIKANPLQSRCQDAAKGASWEMDAPNYSARSPNICSGCGCFLIDASHLPFWKQRESELSIVVTEAGTISTSHEFRVHKARMEQARKVIKLIEG